MGLDGWSAPPINRLRQCGHRTSYRPGDKLNPKQPRETLMGQEFWMGLGAGAAVGAIIAAIVVYLIFGKPKPPEPPKPAKPSGAPLRMLALLQREGRLLDFLMEDIS